MHGRMSHLRCWRPNRTSSPLFPDCRRVSLWRSDMYSTVSYVPLQTAFCRRCWGQPTSFVGEFILVGRTAYGQLSSSLSVTVRPHWYHGWCHIPHKQAVFTRVVGRCLATPIAYRLG